MVVIGKAVGEEGVQAILKLIASRASNDEAVLIKNLGEGFNVEQEKVNVSYATDDEINAVIAGFDDIFD